MKPPTWAFERAAVGIALASTVALTAGDWRQGIAAAAVLASFAHAQVSDRLAEAEAARERIGATPIRVHCHRLALRWLVAKELLWLAFFVSIASWASLVGVAAFLGYPLWRRWYRKRRPLARESYEGRAFDDALAAELEAAERRRADARKRERALSRFDR